jgi:hypothetical protein
MNSKTEWDILCVSYFSESKQAAMVWSVVHRVVTLFWDTLRYSRLSPDDKTLELLLLRQQILILRRHRRRVPDLTRSKKFILESLLDSRDLVVW